MVPASSSSISSSTGETNLALTNVAVFRSVKLNHRYCGLNHASDRKYGYILFFIYYLAFTEYNRFPVFIKAPVCFTLRVPNATGPSWTGQIPASCPVPICSSEPLRPYSGYGSSKTNQRSLVGLTVTADNSRPVNGKYHGSLFKHTSCTIWS